jgi:DNA modification methylase
VSGQIGLESSLTDYLAELVTVFKEIWRILHPSGVVFLEVGDAYAAKNLLGVPWRIAFALQDMGFYLRSDIIWNKPSAMPESVTDRPTKSHSYVFLLSKSERYFYDAEAIRESHQEASLKRVALPLRTNRNRDYPGSAQTLKMGEGQRMCHPDGRNARSVWSIPSEGFSNPGGTEHYAVMPTALAARCIKAGSSQRGCCSAKLKKLKLKSDLSPERRAQVMAYLTKKGLL